MLQSHCVPVLSLKLADIHIYLNCDCNSRLESSSLSLLFWHFVAKIKLDAENGLLFNSQLIWDQCRLKCSSIVKETKQNGTKTSVMKNIGLKCLQLFQTVFGNSKRQRSDDPLVAQAKATKEAGLSDELILLSCDVHQLQRLKSCFGQKDKRLNLTKQLAGDHRPVALGQHRPRPPSWRWAGSPNRWDQSRRFAWHWLSPTGDISLSHDGRRSARCTSGLMVPHNENFPESSSLSPHLSFSAPAFPLDYSKCPKQFHLENLKESLSRFLWS